MECNKEEALRAKDIAEKKMHNKDFVGAKKVLLKAQQLFPDLANVSQMLAVCEVHCSVGNKVNGETDWYGVLQIELAADDSYIKKQYRKLALLLHPDKNKFSGAEAAFKLIGEAHMTLSDPMKRSIHDMKRKSNIRTVPSRPPSQPPKRTSHAHVNSVNQQQQPPSEFAAPQTFWTSCSLCGMRYQYYLSLKNKPIRCQKCMQPFIAYDLNAGMNSCHPRNHSENPKQSQGNSGGAPSQPPSRSVINTKRCGGSTKNTREDGKVGDEGGAGNKLKSDEVKLEGVKKRETGKPSAGNTGKKRGRKIRDSGDSDSTDAEDIVLEQVGSHEEQHAGTGGSYYPRRSTRQKKDVTYNEVENEDDDGFVSHPSSKKVPKGGSSSNAGQSIKVQLSETAVSDNKIDSQHKGDASHEESLPNGYKVKTHDRQHGAGEKEVKAKAKASSNAASSKKASLDLGSFTYPDPEFYDFEKGRDMSQFAIDQIWAVYDNLDGMPRFYARIRNICTPHFKVRFTWLEHNPAGEAELAWSKEELPVACGNYILGKSLTTRNRLMFSHLMSWGKGTRRNSYDIKPKKGEVWALFKGWDISWTSDAGSHRLHEYEVVEVLSEFEEGVGVSVIPLVRIKGFVSLFMRPNHNRMAPHSIPSGEVLRFSHKVPSYRLTGGERNGVPEGSFELDPASLPTNFGESFPAVDMDDVSSGICFKSANCTEKLSGGAVKTSTELNGNNIWETKNTTGHLSPIGEKGLCQKKQNQGSEDQHVDAEACNKMEHEAMAPELEKVNVEGLCEMQHDRGSAGQHVDAEARDKMKHKAMAPFEWCATRVLGA